MEQGQEQGEEVVGEDLGAFGRGVDPVFLNGTGNRVDVGVKHGQQGHMVFRCDEVVGLVEGLDVVGTVVRGQRYTGEDDFAAGVEKGADDGIEVAARIRDREAAETVVAAEFHNNDSRVEAQHILDPVDAVFAGIAADAGANDFVVVAAAVEVGLEIVRIRMPRRDSIAGGNAVAEADDYRNGTGRSGVCREREKQNCQGDETAQHIDSLATGRQGVSRLKQYATYPYNGMRTQESG